MSAEQHDVGGDGGGGGVLLVLHVLTALRGAGDDERGRPVELGRRLGPRRLLEAAQGLGAQDPEAPRIGEVMVRGPPRQLEQLVEHLALHGRRVIRLDRAAGADGLLDLHGGKAIPARPRVRVWRDGAYAARCATLTRGSAIRSGARLVRGRRGAEQMEGESRGQRHDRDLRVDAERARARRCRRRRRRRRTPCSRRSPSTTPRRGSASARAVPSGWNAISSRSRARSAPAQRVESPSRSSAGPRRRVRPRARPPPRTARTSRSSPRLKRRVVLAVEVVADHRPPGARAHASRASCRTPSARTARSGGSRSISSRWRSPAERQRHRRRSRAGRRRPRT